MILLLSVDPEIIPSLYHNQRKIAFVAIFLTHPVYNSKTFLTDCMDAVGLNGMCFPSMYI